MHAPKLLRVPSLHRCYQRVDSTGADALYTPASRGIARPAEVRRQQLAALCMASLPRGAVECGHCLTGVHEDSDGVTLQFQVGLHAGHGLF